MWTVTSSTRNSTLPWSGPGVCQEMTGALFLICWLRISQMENQGKGPRAGGVGFSVVILFLPCCPPTSEGCKYWILSHNWDWSCDIILDQEVEVQILVEVKGASGKDKWRWKELAPFLPSSLRIGYVHLWSDIEAAPHNHGLTGLRADRTNCCARLLKIE